MKKWNDSNLEQVEGEVMGDKKLQVKSIFCKIYVSGQGVVGYEGTQEVRKKTASGATIYAKNHKVAKKVEFQGDETPLLKISENAMRHYWMKQRQFFHTSHNLDAMGKMGPLMKATASQLLRGFTDAGRGFKRKSPVTLTAAIQSESSSAKITQETLSNSGFKDSNSLYSQDSVGIVKYESQAIIDLSELGVFICDDICDRSALSEDDYPVFRERVKELHDEDLPENMNYLHKKTSEIPICERGALFPNTFVEKLASIAIDELTKIEIRKSTSFAEISKVDVFFMRPHQFSIATLSSQEPDLTLYPDEDNKTKILDHFSNFEIISNYTSGGDDLIAFSKEYKEELEKKLKDKKIKKEEKEKKKKKGAERAAL